jgi:hypothetical protein
VALQGAGEGGFSHRPWAVGEYVIVEPLHLIPHLKHRTSLSPTPPFAIESCR